jgi:hypothetical protein
MKRRSQQQRDRLSRSLVYLMCTIVMKKGTNLYHVMFQAPMLPGLAQHPILLLGHMCDRGCDITFTAEIVTVKHGTSIILAVKSDQDSGIWIVPLEVHPPPTPTPPPTANNVYEQNSLQDTIVYLHACFFSLTQDTWVEAIENWHFAT